jgi:hypothetical protein
VRSMSDRELHQVGFRFQHERAEAGLTERQEWLWDAIISELEWRRSVTRWPESRCSCELCWGPFDPQLDEL